MKSTTIFRLRHNRKYITYVNTSHGFVCVEFSPIILFSRIENSIFSTNDEEVITALKKSCDHGSLFFVEEEGIESVIRSAQQSTGAKKSGEEDKDHDGGTIHDLTVTSRNKAIDYLLKNFGSTFSSTDSIAEMKIEAKEKYNVEFDNWK